MRIISVRRAREKEVFGRGSYLKNLADLPLKHANFMKDLMRWRLRALIDMSNAQVTYHGKKVRITLDIAESLVRDIDQEYVKE